VSGTIDSGSVCANSTAELQNKTKNKKKEAVFFIYAFFKYYNQRIEIHYYNMFRSYGTITLRNRAIGSDYFVRLDFSPVLFQHRIIANADARKIPVKAGVISNHGIV
jgi:hypothetical protein